jgi:hypothetical protein
MKRLKVGLLAAAAAAAACASVVPGSESVVLTRDEKAVAGCKELGNVSVWISFSFGDARNQLRNRAHAMNGDTVLVSSSWGESDGTAYSCAQKKP